MNRCLTCGKEIPDSRKFCCSSCSASYNNRVRKRKPWSEEQKQKITVKRVEQICRYCNRPTGLKVREKERRAFGTCPECRLYWKANLYEKVGLSSGSLKERFKTVFTRLEQMYIEDRLSALEISKRTGIHEQVIRKVLLEGGEILRTRSESQKTSLESGERTVSGCNPRYKHGWYETWEGRQIFYRSSWELEYALRLDEQQISYDVEDLRIKYFDTQKNEERVAIPDFHLLETNEIVEIKSSWTYDEQLMKDKFKAYREAGYVPRLILDKKEVSVQF